MSKNANLSGSLSKRRVIKYGSAATMALLPGCSLPAIDGDPKVRLGLVDVLNFSDQTQHVQIEIKKDEKIKFSDEKRMKSNEKGDSMEGEWRIKEDWMDEKSTYKITLNHAGNQASISTTQIVNGQSGNHDCVTVAFSVHSGTPPGVFPDLRCDVDGA